MISRRDFLEKMALVPFAFAIPKGVSGTYFNEDSDLFDDSYLNQKQMQFNYEPPYLELHRQGELKKRGEALWSRMEECNLCPRNCDANRLKGERGDCNSNSNLEVSSFGPHFGEERELVGRNGSGTIFFTNCSLLCVFCINYDISQLGQGRRYSVKDLADMMLNLQRRGCHNINLVTPTHYSPHILLALDRAASRGLRLPVVYNTCGWEKTDVLKNLDGVVDIYLTDFKYGCPEKAGTYSIDAHDYVEVTQKAHLEIQHQVGTAWADEETGLMIRGLMLRHLVMPNNVSCTDKVMQWIAENLPKDTYVNLMSQYTPMFRANEFPVINRRLYTREYAAAIESATKAGLTNVRTQGYTEFQISDFRFTLKKV
jgi:putative pyruvate formate lyase activating enzyme